MNQHREVSAKPIMMDYLGTIFRAGGHMINRYTDKHQGEFNFVS